MRIFVSGSGGLVGDALLRACESRGHEVVPFDLVRPAAAIPEDICDVQLLDSLLPDCDGVVHLAAISRVAWGEARPDLCRRTNVEGTRAILRAAASAPKRPWVLFASSREVYGNPVRDLVLESDPIAPVNIYGQSKADGELLVDEARSQGLGTAIVRLSNVYGGRQDHPDRAVPSFLTRALRGEDMCVTGGRNYFDFVHVDDCIAGLMATIGILASGDKMLPPIHLATGIATKLYDLAVRARDIGGGRSMIHEEMSRPFDVSGFCGSPDRARALLGWQATIGIQEGMERVAEDLATNGPLLPVTIPDPEAFRIGRVAIP
ncbi:MAG: NAD-dependent epimerase/dehydratase family protein [Sphingobium sp.]